jgi:Transglycosylase SLT domain
VFKLRPVSIATYGIAGLVVLTTISVGAAVTLAQAGGSPTPPAPAPTPHAAPSKAVTLPELRTLTPPDVVVAVPRAAALAKVDRLRKRPGVRRVVLASRGTVAVHGHRLHVLGVPVSGIRGLTPQLTATSLPLWQSIASGELTVAYANAGKLRKHLGATYQAHTAGGRAIPLRIGAFATIGLPHAQALLDTAAAAAAGLAPRRVALIVAPKVPLGALKSEVGSAFGPNATVTVTRPAQVDQSESSTYATSTIPALYLDLYRRAAVTCPGLPWTVLAGIGTVETGNGRDVHRSTAGALGPMQFMPSTWAVYGYDADGDGKANIHDPTDAVFSAARYLCAAGAGRGGQSIDDAIFAYNHAWWYVREVITIANQYA